MLLFSAQLEINDIMTKDAFVRLVIDWNQRSPHIENRIENIEWNGERSVRYGTDKLSLAIEEYQRENIIGVRYEKIEDDGIVWDTDYIMNFNEMKMSIQLDRSFLAEALTINAEFSTPFFIALLIEHNFIKTDNLLPILKTPHFINTNNLEILADIINGTKKYQIPIVYVSKTYANEDPVDIYLLAKKLKGVAHVLVEENVQLNSSIRKLCNDKNEYHGAIGIYFPNDACGHKKFIYRSFNGINTALAEKVIRNVIQYSNSQMVDSLYTWQGVNNALLRDRFDSQSEKLIWTEQEKERITEESNKLIEIGDEDIQHLKQQVNELTRANEVLIYENQGLRAKINGAAGLPVLYFGDENEFFPEEIKMILLDELKTALSRYSSGTRRNDVLTYIIQNNDYNNTIAERKTEIKSILKGYKNISNTMRHALQNLGFNFSEYGKHYKLTYYGDERYCTTLSKTPSDDRSGLNTATTIIKNMF